MISDTWGNGASVTQGWLQMGPKFITYLFVNNHEHALKINDDSRYAAKNECTHKLNKYECISLPTTTCNIPISFINGTDSLRKYGDRIYFDKAATDGVLIPGNDIHKYNEFMKDDTKYKKVQVTDEMNKWEFTKHQLHDKYSYIHTGKNPYITKETTFSSKGDGISSGMIKNIFGFAYRANTDFRIKIQHHVDKFRASTHPTFHSNQTCVFAHLRYRYG